VIWITALYPYVVLVIFFVRAIFLEGMADGILHLFKPKVREISGKSVLNLAPWRKL
jgi:SNF family Na+-dependent transporter